MCASEKEHSSHEAVLVDAHVHVQGCFDDQAFFEAAAKNFDFATRALGLRRKAAFLMLTESRGADHFYRFQKKGCKTGSWSILNTEEECSLLVGRDGDVSLVLVAGRQIVTGDGLEVLALGSRRQFEDGLSLEETARQVLESSALAVIPWGFGKWWFRRGQVVSSMLTSKRHPNLFLGDNRGRIALAGKPRLFQAAELANIWILPGSDPLPFPDQVRHPGSYGCVLEGSIDYLRPAQSVKTLLRSAPEQPETYGKLETLAPFLRNNVRMQMRKVIRKLRP